MSSPSTCVASKNFFGRLPPSRWRWALGFTTISFGPMPTSPTTLCWSGSSTWRTLCGRRFLEVAMPWTSSALPFQPIRSFTILLFFSVLKEIACIRTLRAPLLADVFGRPSTPSGFPRGKSCYHQFRWNLPFPTSLRKYGFCCITTSSPWTLSWMLEHASTGRVLVSGIYNHEFPRRCFFSSIDPSLKLTSCVAQNLVVDFLFLIPLLVPSLP